MALNYSLFLVWHYSWVFRVFKSDRIKTAGWGTRLLDPPKKPLQATITVTTEHRSSWSVPVQSPPQQNISDLERVQKSATKIILKNSYINYQNALRRLNLDDLMQRRNQLCKSFAKPSVKNASIYFEPNDKLHSMNTRNTNIYRIKHCNTEGFNKSAMPQMQRMLNCP